MEGKKIKKRKDEEDREGKKENSESILLTVYIRSTIVLIIIWNTGIFFRSMFRVLLAP
jgi:hypothetical protein